MESFPWWNEEQKRLATEIEGFVKELMPEAEEAWWKREIALDVFDKVAQKGYLGVGIPEAYGGMGLGATGACIAMETLSLLPGAFYICGASMMGGLHQIMEFGNEEQKRRFLPRIARGELGSIAITEPFAGTDVGCHRSRAGPDRRRVDAVRLPPQRPVLPQRHRRLQSPENRYQLENRHCGLYGRT